MPAWLCKESQTAGAALPNCLARLQLLIDPINSNESGFLQSDLLPLLVVCLSLGEELKPELPALTKGVREGEAGEEKDR